MRQHGDGAVREVDACAADAGFGVEGGFGADVVADVGDVDLQLGVAVGQRTDEDGVVEVLGGFAVDGDDGKPAEVFALGELLASKSGDGLFGFCFGFRKDVRWELVRDVVLADDDFYVHTEGVRRAEDFDDAASGRAAGEGNSRISTSTARPSSG